ncbi:MAG: lipid II flippase MurJ, partial [Phyllobacterium sp.]
FLTLPAAAALLVMSEPIIRLLLERGEFTAESTARVSSILAIYGLGLPAFVLIKAFIPGFFAREDTKTPMIYAAVSVVINVAMALTLFPILAEAGIATAEVTAGWVNATLLFATLLWRGHWGRDIPLLTRIPRLFLSAAIMAFALYHAIDWAAPYLAPHAPFQVQALAVFGLILLSMVLYFALAFATGGASFGMIRRNVKRGARTNGTPPDQEAP